MNINDVKRAIQAIAGRVGVGAVTKDFTAKSLRVGCDIHDREAWAMEVKDVEQGVF